jgi:tyrosyl-tRNA synthetase
MGKSAQGAVWLNDGRVSPYEYFQYWRNTEDADIGRFLKLFTELPLDEIARLAALAGAEINDAKKVLAFEATKLCHGDAAANEAAETARRTFEDGTAGDALPTVSVAADRLQAGVPLYQLLVEAKVSTSNGEARRLIQQGGARLDDEVIRDPAYLVRLAPGRDTIKLTAGKKRHALVRAG